MGYGSYGAGKKSWRWARVAGGLLRVRGGLGGFGNLRGWSSSLAWIPEGRVDPSSLGLVRRSISERCYPAFRLNVMIPVA